MAAAKLDPKNAEIRTTYEQLKEQQKIYNDKAKGLFKAAFSKEGLYGYCLVITSSFPSQPTSTHHKGRHIVEVCARPYMRCCC